MRMRCPVESLPLRAGIVVLLTVTLFVIVVRPLTRPTGHLYARFGLTRMSLLTEGAGDKDASMLPPPTSPVGLSPFLVLGVPLLALKTRRVGFRPIPVRRVKRPPRRPASSLLTDPR